MDYLFNDRRKYNTQDRYNSKQLAVTIILNSMGSRIEFKIYCMDREKPFCILLMESSFDGWIQLCRFIEQKQSHKLHYIFKVLLI